MVKAGPEVLMVWLALADVPDVDGGCCSLDVCHARSKLIVSLL